MYTPLLAGVSIKHRRGANVKQVILIGNFNRWETEAEFICEMLQMTATRVILINIGRGEAPADLNAKELRQLFPGKTLEDCVHLAISKLYLQGIADGILVLLGKEPHYYALADKAFAAMPFGLPKAAILSGDCTWQGRRDILHIYLPGTGYNMNPVIKILLCNTAFAISGMCLCSIHNFGSSAPTVGTMGFRGSIGKYFAGAGLNYIAFSDNDPMLPPLLRNGYIHGLMLASEAEFCLPSLDIAAAREIPVVIISRNPGAIKASLDYLPALSGPVTIISSHHQETPHIVSQEASPLWVHCRSISCKYGSDSFYRYAVKTLADQIT